MKHRRATLLLLLALALPAPASAEAFDDMFGLMFRMMLTAMNVMADMANNNNSRDWPGSGWSNPSGTMWPGSTMLWPAMGLGGWPGSVPGMSPLGMNPWGGGLPWGSGIPWGGAMPGGGGTTPWGGLPWSGGSSPWNAGGIPFNGGPWRSARGGGPKGLPGVPSPVRSAPLTSLLDGKWYGNTGEILEIRGNRFRLRNGRLTIKGVASIDQNLLRLYSPQTNSLSMYSFARNQTGLMLQEPSGNVLIFRQHHIGGISAPVHVF